ncbi:unnamed protein product [Closterium sp. Naga37s-1]|nr:unnamed protein product [Closterium sp. Naga37s-1]
MPPVQPMPPLPHLLRHPLPQAETAHNPFHFAFRRVVAVEGDEIVPSRPSDEPFWIEDHFWLLADNPDVPAKVNSMLPRFVFP